MGVLSNQMRQCAWLTRPDQINELCQMLVLIENWIHKECRKKKSGPFPPERVMLMALTKLQKIPDLVIVGQDPYPSDNATGIAFQTPIISGQQSARVKTRSLSCLAKGLGLPKGTCPNIERWVSVHNVLMLNVALCNFGRCCRPIDLLAKFSTRVLDFVCQSNPNVVIMLLGSRAHALCATNRLVVKCGHPALCVDPNPKHWQKIENALKDAGSILRLHHLRESPIQMLTRKQAMKASH